MRKVSWRTPLVLLVAISLPAMVILTFRRAALAPESETPDYNPDKFYMSVNGKVISYSFTYDPHEADAWMFRTAEGHLESANHRPDTPLGPMTTAP